MAGYHSQRTADAWLASKDPYSGMRVFQSSVLSTDGPSLSDLENEVALREVLRGAGKLKESRAEQRKREVALSELQAMVRDWVLEHSIDCGMVSSGLCAESELPVKGDIYAFGSYRLGVHSSADDIDVLVVAPQYISHDDFFDGFGPRLEENSRVGNLRKVRDAFVPVMNFDYDGVDIDMVYAGLKAMSRLSAGSGQPKAATLDIFSDDILRFMETRHIHAMNGTRIAKKLLERVPDASTYKLALRAIRYWAKARGIYSNKLGFPGGVAYAILCGKVCQMYPNHNAAQLIVKFFLFCHTWNFGTSTGAISLNRPQWYDDMPPHIQNMAWKPKDANGHAIMHVLTPAYPCINSTHNVSLCTFDVLKREFARGYHMLLSMAESRSAAERRSDWTRLFAQTTFFMDYPFYIHIRAMAPKDIYADFSGLVEARLRHIVADLELADANLVVRPLNKGIDVKPLNRRTLQLKKKRAVCQRFEDAAKLREEREEREALERSKAEAKEKEELVKELQTTDIGTAAVKEEIDESGDIAMAVLVDASGVAVESQRQSGDAPLHAVLKKKRKWPNFEYIYGKDYVGRGRGHRGHGYRPKPSGRQPYANKYCSYWIRAQQTEPGLFQRLSYESKAAFIGTAIQQPNGSESKSGEEQTDAKAEAAAITWERLKGDAIRQTFLDECRVLQIISAPMFVSRDLHSLVCCNDWSLQKLYANRALFDCKSFFIGVAFTNRGGELGTVAADTIPAIEKGDKTEEEKCGKSHSCLCNAADDDKRYLSSAALSNACAVFFESLKVHKSALFSGCHVTVDIEKCHRLPSYVLQAYGSQRTATKQQCQRHQRRKDRRDRRNRHKHTVVTAADLQTAAARGDATDDDDTDDDDSDDSGEKEKLPKQSQIIGAKKRVLSDMSETDSASIVAKGVVETSAKSTDKLAGQSADVKMEEKTPTKTEAELLQKLVMQKFVHFGLRRALQKKEWATIAEEMNKKVNAILKTAAECDTRWKADFERIAAQFGFNVLAKVFTRPLPSTEVQNMVALTGTRFQKHRKELGL